MMERLSTDLLVFGSGGAGLFAALHASETQPDLRITIVVKGLYGKSGCTRMVQGGYNAVLHPQDSHERHFQDTVVGGQFLNDQALAWTLVQQAPERILELENRVGCRFDRNEDGTLHQKPFGGQSFDRTVHRGDLTGIEIISRLAEQVSALPNVTILQECRGIELLPAQDGDGIAGALVLDIRRGAFMVVEAPAVLMATGGGARMYRYSSPSIEKSGDGIAMAARAGAELIDMEMLQFHPTGLMAGESLLTGSVVEEGLRGAGGILLNIHGQRFMEDHDPERLERSTRDIVSRAMYLEIMQGRGTPQGGVWLDVSHLGSEFVNANFPGMCHRASLVGRDLGSEPIEVCPTSHFHMGGARIAPDCSTGVRGLFAAGEDAGGVHGANRLGGNGVAESTVFGAVAGDSIAAWLQVQPAPLVDDSRVEEVVRRTTGYLDRPRGESPFALRAELGTVMWEHAGVVRDEAGLEQGLVKLADIRSRLDQLGVAGRRESNLLWGEALNVESSLWAAEAVMRGALARRESRGAHRRSDLPEQDDPAWMCNVVLSPRPDGSYDVRTEPVALARVTPEHVLERG